MASFLFLSSLGLDRSFDPKPGNPLILVKPHSDESRGIPGAFLADPLQRLKARAIGKIRNLTKPRYLKYEPVMFDMDPFGDKKVPCTSTKYQESGSSLLDRLPYPLQSSGSTPFRMFYYTQ